MDAICEFPSHMSSDNHAFPHIFQPLALPNESFDANFYADFKMSTELTASSLIRALEDPTPFTAKDAANSILEDPIVVNHPVVVPVKNEVESEEDEDVFVVQDEEVKLSEMQSTLEISMKNVLVCMIGEYLSEGISLRQFLAKIRTCLYAPDSSAANKEVFTWILRCMLEGGAGSDGGSHVHRMASFLEENGVTKDEIEASSAAITDEANGNLDFDIGEKRKRREKKSISRGLRSAPNKWSKAESQTLIRLVHENGDKSWKRIAEQLGGGKTGAQCAQHWKRVLSPQIRKGSWDDQEEELLLALVERYGQSWKNIAGEIKTRTDIQCRYQYQKSCLSRQCEWQEQEDALLVKKVAQMLHEGSGSNNPTRANLNISINWVEVAKFIARAKLTKIPRTALECKQRWCLTRNNPPPQHTTQQHSPSLVLSNQHPHSPQQLQHPHSPHNQHPHSPLNQHPHSPHNQHPHSPHQPTNLHVPSPTPTPLTLTTPNHNNSNNMNSHQFHNINYSNINNTYTMVSAAAQQTF